MTPPNTIDGFNDRYSGRLWDAIVVGGGPAGLIMVATLLKENLETSILWIDRDGFTGGRLKDFQFVSSNTRVNLFLKYGEFVEGICGRKASILDELRGQPHDKGCKLSLAWKMVVELSHTIAATNLNKLTAELIKVQQSADGKRWYVRTSMGSFESYNVILATGSRPKAPPLEYRNLAPSINPEVLLAPCPESKLFLGNLGPSDIIAVVGGSHSAILILQTLLNNSKVGTVINFHREPLRFAEYQPNGTIIYDNVGLKGETAVWAKTFLLNPDQKSTNEEIFFEGRLCRISTLADGQPLEREAFYHWLAKCKNVVWAIGYEPETIDTILFQADSRQRLYQPEEDVQEGIYGLGIAFPQLVCDHPDWPPTTPAVGLFKFMRSATLIEEQVRNRLQCMNKNN